MSSPGWLCEEGLALIRLALRLEGMDRGSEGLEDCCDLGLDAVIRMIG